MSKKKESNVEALAGGILFIWNMFCAFFALAFFGFVLIALWSWIGGRW